MSAGFPNPVVATILKSFDGKLREIFSRVTVRRIHQMVGARGATSTNLALGQSGESSTPQWASFVGGGQDRNLRWTVLNQKAGRGFNPRPGRPQEQVSYFRPKLKLIVELSFNVI